jgi:hypothetical protein
MPKKHKVDTPVCVWCRHELVDGQVVGKIQHSDELGFVTDVFWHKECRIEFLRELASDSMAEADRLELEEDPQKNRSKQ